MSGRGAGGCRASVAAAQRAVCVRARSVGSAPIAARQPTCAVHVDLTQSSARADECERPGTTRAADVSRAHLLTLYAHFVPLVHCSLAEVRAAVAEVLVEVGTALGARRLDV